MTTLVPANNLETLGFPGATPESEKLGLKFSIGGAHISRTMMLTELDSILVAVPAEAAAHEYREAILVRNVLSKTTESTRQKSLRHLRELYALDEAVPLFALLRKLSLIDNASLPLLALQVAWGRDPLLRATTAPILTAGDGDRVETVALSEALESKFPGQYSELNRHKIARNAASTWTQSGHLVGRTKKIRVRINPSPVAVTLALFLGQAIGFHGASVFANPWCRLLDLTIDQARSRALDAHRAGLINLRAVGEVVELDFPLFAEYHSKSHERH